MLGFFLAILAVMASIVAVAVVGEAASRNKRVRITQFGQNGAVIGSFVATGLYTINSTNGSLTYEMPDSREKHVIHGDYRIEPLPKGETA